MITIARNFCSDIDKALDREWLVANGTGGYASSTIVGANTRRYHGLLVAALKPPVERTVLLAKVDEEVQIGDRTLYLGVNEYPDGKIYPGGLVHLEEFRLEEGLPVSLYRIGDGLLEKRVWMERGQNTVYVRYSYLEGEEECLIRLLPFCNYRDYHGMTRGSFDWDFLVEPLDGACKVVAKEGATPFWIAAPGAEFTPTGVWYWNFVYRREVERGYTEREDLYMVGVLRTTLRPGESVTFVASTLPPETFLPQIDGALERELARARALLKGAGIKPRFAGEEASDPAAPVEAFAAELVRAADSFLVTRNVSRDGATKAVPTVLAGYHWFTDWGRDTMIALPGLTIPTRRIREANQTLKTFSLFVRDGMLPNNFPDEGDTPQYNTVDATLWMFAAVGAIAAASGRLTAAQSLYPVLSDIIAWHVRGTRYGIGMDPEDGLLRAGEEGVQLTWMDAKIDDWVVTPRTGKPVEINALWYNALHLMARLQGSFSGRVPPGTLEPPDFGELAEQVRYSFRERFWYAHGGYLYDVVDGPSGNDPSLRPNQVIAVALGNDLLTKEQGRAVLSAVRRHLLTPYGLRTLAPHEPDYSGHYRGTRRERDSVYHQGAVWPWLLGPYLDAVRAVEGEEDAREELRGILPALRRHLATGGLGSISEIFEGDHPHEMRGCVSQAWSVSEVLRHVWGPGRLL